jgi:hypothetical protein
LASYDQIIFRKSWNSKCHNFWMERPNWLILFWANHIWCVLSKSIITFY